MIRRRGAFICRIARLRWSDRFFKITIWPKRMENARFTVSPHRGCNIVIESRVTPEVRQKLSSMGHQLDVRNAYTTAMGRGQAVLHDSKSKVNYGASDARADRAAVPEQ